MIAFTGTLSIKSLLLVKTKSKSDALLVSLPQVSSFTCCSKKAISEGLYKFKVHVIAFRAIIVPFNFWVITKRLDRKLSGRYFNVILKFSEFSLLEFGLLYIKTKIILSSSEFIFHINSSRGDVVCVGSFIIWYDKSFFK